MPPVLNLLPLHQPLRSGTSLDCTQTQDQSSIGTGRIVFTRQLWQRNMPIGNSSEQSVLNKSQTSNSHASHNTASESSRRTSSTTSLRSRRRSLSPLGDSKTPLTPEESPPFRTTRKRSAGVVEQEDRNIDSSETSPTHTRASSGDSAVHVCICQPDPKIPRPRNAFILYRQHHQANVVARNPGLANPEISKIIGEQWQNEIPEQKNKWKALAEEEKLRHHQQYPTYRYQPKRNARRNSTDAAGLPNEKPKCQKCSGRMILAPAPYSTGQSGSLPPTPGTVITPLTQTLPVLRDLSLESPATRQLRGSYHMHSMSPNHRHHSEDRDEIGPLSPESKRRRVNVDPSATWTRVLPPRYGAVLPNAAVGPGTPFPFGQPPPPHAYPPPGLSSRRESLPGIRGVVSPPGAMAPPPRPGMGYHQHRLSQGHIPQDRSLTLPPLQTAPSTALVRSAGTGKTADEQIMSISFRYKIKVLCQVAPPMLISKEAPRGPLIAVEGDTLEAVAELAGWLNERLSIGEDLSVNLLDGPQILMIGGKEEAMAQYHRLAAEWLSKNKDIWASVRVKKVAERDGDAAMADDAAAAASSSTPRVQSDAKSEKDNSNGDESNTSEPSHAARKDGEDTPTDALEYNNTKSHPSINAEKMELDTSSTPTFPHPSKSVTLIPNYSLYTSNTFARMIELSPHDPYTPNDHWQWTATLWRGIVGPDLTIYLRDVHAGAAGVDTGPSVEIGGVEGRSVAGLIVVRRVVGDGEGGAIGIEPSVLRRVGFEVGEWIRGFGVGVL